jgi:hypothetical protein
VWLLVGSAQLRGTCADSPVAAVAGCGAAVAQRVQAPALGPKHLKQVHHNSYNSALMTTQEHSDRLQKCKLCMLLKINAVGQGVADVSHIAVNVDA